MIKHQLLLVQPFAREQLALATQHVGIVGRPLEHAIVKSDIEIELTLIAKLSQSLLRKNTSQRIVRVRFIRRSRHSAFAPRDEMHRSRLCASCVYLTSRRFEKTP